MGNNVMRYNSGLGISSLDHRRREKFSAISSYAGEIRMKELSILLMNQVTLEK